jgi:hypothetical protein
MADSAPKTSADQHVWRMVTWVAAAGATGFVGRVLRYAALGTRGVPRASLTGHGTAHDALPRSPPFGDHHDPSESLAPPRSSIA